MTPSDPTQEQGAVAITVAITLIVLLGISAFALDFGLTYTNKRQLQTSADAAAVAAAATYADDEGDCTALANDTTLAAEAHTAAENLMDDNYGTATEVPGTFDVRCSDTGGVEVEWANEALTDVGLGGVFGASDVNASRTAVASLEVPGSVLSGLRPYAICSNDKPDPVETLPTKVHKIQFPEPSPTSPAAPCPASNNPGNFWTIRCPESTSSSSMILAEKTRNGCDDEVAIVANQPASDPANGSPALKTHLVDVGCANNPPRADKDCLRADPGEFNAENVREAWNSLLGQTITVPIFCGDAVCDPGAVYDAGGSNAHYPVYNLTAVTVCGYDWGNGGPPPPSTKSFRGITTAGPCANNPDGYTVANMDPVASGGEGMNYMLVVFQQIQTSGSTTPSGCSIGDPECDGGLRQVFLTR